MNDPLLNRIDNDDHAEIPALLRALPELAPPQDRLAQVLAQVQAQRAEKPRVAADPAARAPARWWLSWAAAAMSAVVLLSWYGSAEKVPAPLAESTNLPLEAASEITLLRWQSQVLERQMHALRDDRGSLRQLDGLSVAALRLAALDAQLESNELPVSEALLSQQRALWRERVAVLQAVNQGQYQPALYAID